MARTNQELIAAGTEQYLSMKAELAALGMTMGEIVKRLPPDAPPPPPVVEDPPPNVEEPPAEDPVGEDPSVPPQPGPGPFAPGGKYAWMSAVGTMPTNAETGAFPLFLNSNVSDQVADLTGLLDGKVWVGTSKSKWPAGVKEEHGPKWLVRAYNAFGRIQNLTAYRVGDFHKGREGHVLYCNLLGDLKLSNVKAVQCGGQFGQFVWRPSETRIEEYTWPENVRPLLVIRSCEAIDCGAINEGTAVRASWPLAFYNPGHDIRIEGFRVRTKFAPFSHPGKVGTFRSHGGLFIGHGQIPRRCQEALVNDLDVEVTQSDRDLVRLWGINGALLTAPRLVHHGGEPSVAIVDDCDRVVIDQPVEDVVVKFHEASKPYGMAYRREVAIAGRTWEWRR